MKIVHAASELYPYMKTGGLADAVGALTGTFADMGHEVSAFLPGYREALAHPAAAGAERRFRLKIEMGDQYLSGDVLAFSPRKNLTVYLICRDEFFDRRYPYGNGEQGLRGQRGQVHLLLQGRRRDHAPGRPRRGHRPHATTGRRRSCPSCFARPSGASG